MKQYNSMKARYPGAVLLFRVGDFYETFGQDAIVTARVLDIVLTKRANGSASHVELAGFPHHALDAYLPRLVNAGHRVAVCDQLEDPKQAKGIVKRGVTELVTPGLSFNENVLEQKRNNYLAALHITKDVVGLALLDISTGEFLTTRGTEASIQKIIQGFKPSEVLFARPQQQAWQRFFDKEVPNHAMDDWVFQYEFAHDRLTAHFGTSTLKGFGVHDMPEGIVAAGAILYYLEQTEHTKIQHIGTLQRIEEERYVWLDRFTIRNLELVYAQQEGGVPLIEVLDHTYTPMGGRLLKKWVVLPLKEVAAINKRLDAVKALMFEEVAEGVEERLQHIGDLERLISKVAVGRINPREMVQLRKALEQTGPLKVLLEQVNSPALQAIGQQLDACPGLCQQIGEQLKDDPPLNPAQGNLMADGIDAELDELRQIAFSGKDYLVQIQQREMEATGIGSLKIAYNKVFGYYLEVTNAHKDKVPETWIRKQTLVNAERYITPELKEYEEKILTAEEKLQVIELRLFTALVAAAEPFVGAVQKTSRLLAQLDCLLSFAKVSRQRQYVRPEVSDDEVLDIQEGRHPVIETQLPPDAPYVPNDVALNSQEQQIMVITGPNMAGKSALLRQTALIVLMAQMGCYVPAAGAKVGIIDKVFTRVGASDNLSRGESTFMVEMLETSSILNNLSSRSLVLMDEIGRGTSTYDGISIAWAIVEFLHNYPNGQPKTLFATHYHELNELSKRLDRVHNFNVSVKEVGNKIVFLRKLQPGGSQHSFGINVAQLAGMPNKVVIRAQEILGVLEKDKVGQDKRRQQLEALPTQQFQLNMFEADPRYKKVHEALKQIDINVLSPVEALMKLNEIKMLLNEA